MRAHFVTSGRVLEVPGHGILENGIQHHLPCLILDQTKTIATWDGSRILSSHASDQHFPLWLPYSALCVHFVFSGRVLVEHGGGMLENCNYTTFQADGGRTFASHALDSWLVLWWPWCTVCSFHDSWQGFVVHGRGMKGYGKPTSIQASCMAKQSLL